MSAKIRRATLDDTEFIAEAIIAAEKSGTDKCGLANMFGLTETEAKGYIRDMLEEEIDGCEFSVESFMIAEEEGEPAAAVAGWVEGVNSDDQPSAILKANLISYTLPKENIAHSAEAGAAADGIQIERTEGTLQIEYVYCRAESRGRGYVQQLINAHIAESGAERAEVQVFGENEGAIKLYEKLGFETAKASISDDPRTEELFPSRKKILMTKTIK